MIKTLKKADSAQKFERCIELKKEISATQEKLKRATAATDLAVLTHVQHQLDEALHSARCCNKPCPGCDKDSAQFRSKAYDTAGHIAKTAACGAATGAFAVGVSSLGPVAGVLTAPVWIPPLAFGIFSTIGFKFGP